MQKPVNSGEMDIPHRASASLSGTNLERAGDYNQRVMLQAIRIAGSVTRADLARTTGLTAPSIANITRRLLQDGLLTEARRRDGGRGQPAVTLAIDPDGCFSVGVNIDRDHITVLVLDLVGQVRARTSREGDLKTPAETVELVKTMIAEVLAQAAVPASRVIGTGIAMPDALGRIHLPSRHQLDAWSAVEAQTLFETALTGQVFVENDAAAAAIGEQQFGYGLTHSSFFYILISAGLGGGLVVEGEYFRGASGRSGEVGFLPIASSRTRAATLQEAVSLSALYALLGEHGYAISQPEDLCKLDARGQQVIEGWLDLAADLLTTPLLSVSWLVNPAAILLGGRLPARLVDDLAARLNTRLAKTVSDPSDLAPVKRAVTSEDAPAIGAAILPFMSRLLPSRAALMKTGAP